MSIFVDKDTRVLVQGITGSAGSFHTEQMLAYGTRIVAGVTPNRGGTRFQGTVPIFHTVQGDVVALDAKMNFDDNALYRHPDIAAMRDPDEEDPKETQAKEYDLAYIALDGDIGCMVNGAGLAMATMDVIKLSGGRPANFLDVGGGADEEKVTAAFKILLADPQVKAVLVNIFGGIMKCDVIANGIVAAAKQVGLSIPLVVRLEGTNVQVGKDILAHSDLEIIPADDLGDAARKVVAAARAS